MATKIDFFNWLKKRKGDEVIKDDSSVMQPFNMIDYFIQYLEEYGYVKKDELDGVDESKYFGGDSRFAVGKRTDGKHFVVIDTKNYDGKTPLWDPYTEPYEKNNDYTESYRFTYPYDKLNYNFWR